MVTQTEFVSAAPDFAEKDIVVEFRKFRGKITKLIASGCLFDFFCAILVIVKKLNNKNKKTLFIMIYVIMK